MVTRAATSPKVRFAPLARAGVLAAVIIGLDQLTKHLIRTGIQEGGSERVLPGVHLVHVRNTGVAFSLFSGGGTLVLALTLVALAALLVYFALHPSRPWLWLPTGLLVGGAIGNLIDRLAHGAVTDFVKLPHWPAFNLADTAITVGVLSLVWVIEGRRRDEE